MPHEDALYINLGSIRGTLYPGAEPQKPSYWILSLQIGGATGYRLTTKNNHQEKESDPTLRRQGDRRLQYFFPAGAMHTQDGCLHFSTLSLAIEILLTIFESW